MTFRVLPLSVVLMGILGACATAPEPKPVRSPTAQRTKDTEEDSEKQEAPLVAPPPAYGNRVVSNPGVKRGGQTAIQADSGALPPTY